MGTSGGTDPAMGKSLDEMIADRRKEQLKASKRGPKKTSTADRSIATGRAKREAAMKAKRGMTQEKKPSAMEVEREVYRQSRKSAVSKKKAEKKATGGRMAPNSSLRDTKPKKGDAGKKQAPKVPPTGAAAAVMGGRAPSKKQVEAAIKGMESIGQPVPQGHQLVLTFVPIITATKPDPKGKKGPGGAGGGGGGGGKNQNNNNNRRGGRGYKN